MSTEEAPEVIDLTVTPTARHSPVAKRPRDDDVDDDRMCLEFAVEHHRTKKSGVLTLTTERVAPSPGDDDDSRYNTTLVPSHGVNPDAYQFTGETPDAHTLMARILAASPCPDLSFNFELKTLVTYLPATPAGMVGILDNDYDYDVTELIHKHPLAHKFRHAILCEFFSLVDANSAALSVFYDGPAQVLKALLARCEPPVDTIDYATCAFWLGRASIDKSLRDTPPRILADRMQDIRGE